MSMPSFATPLLGASLLLLAACASAPSPRAATTPPRHIASTGTEAKAIATGSKGAPEGVEAAQQRSGMESGTD